MRSTSARWWPPTRPTGRSRASLAAASHDLRQPLQAARLYLEVLERQLVNPPDTLHKLAMCMENLRELLNKLLDISRLEAGTVEPEMKLFPLGEALERLTEEFSSIAEEKGIRLRVRPCCAEVRTDPQLLSRVLGNLVVNAVRYTHEGGVLVGCRKRGSDVAIQVWDTGIGIPEDEVGRVFDEFYQLGNIARVRRRGVGLGLSIVRRPLRSARLQGARRVARRSGLDVRGPPAARR